MTDTVQTRSGSPPAAPAAPANSNHRNRGGRRITRVLRRITGILRDAGGVWTVVAAVASGGTAWVLGSRPKAAAGLSLAVVGVAVGVALILWALRPGVEAFVLTKEGEEWRVGSPDATFHLPDGTGLRYLHFLLRHPDQDFPVLEVYEAGSDAVGGIGFFGDAKAESAYRRRRSHLEHEIRDLESEAKELEQSGDEDELRLVMEELSRKRWQLVGLEVDTAIEAVLQRIDEDHHALGQHLRGAVVDRAALFYRYSANPAHTPEWEL